MEDICTVLIPQELIQVDLPVESLSSGVGIRFIILRVLLKLCLWLMKDGYLQSAINPRVRTDVLRYLAETEVYSVSTPQIRIRILLRPVCSLDSQMIPTDVKRGLRHWGKL